MVCNFYPLLSFCIILESFSGKEATSNMVSYLTHQEIVEVDSSLRNLTYILIIITIFNLSVTYTFIHLYLNFKHSRAVRIAETSKFNVQESFLSFKKLLVGFTFFSLFGIANYCVYHINLYQNNNHVPPLTMTINFVTVFASLTFIFKKKKVLDFMKRRWRASNINLIPISNQPSRIRKKYSKKIVPIS